jgi:Immunity protein 10
MARVFQFAARVVAVESDGETMLVGLADDKFNTTNYLTFQLDCRPTDQDRALGLDSVHVEIGDQSCSSYGGLDRVTLSDTSLRVLLTEEAAFRMSVGEIDISIDQPAATLQELSDALQRMMPSVFVDARGKTGQ